MSDSICFVAGFVNNMVAINICLITSATNAMRFAYVFVFKAIPVMKDRLLSTFIIIAINAFSFVASIAKFYHPKGQGLLWVSYSQPCTVI